MFCAHRERSERELKSGGAAAFGAVQIVWGKAATRASIAKCGGGRANRAFGRRGVGSSSSAVTMVAPVAFAAAGVAAVAAVAGQRLVKHKLRTSLPGVEGPRVVGTADLALPETDLLVRAFYPTSLEALPEVHLRDRMLPGASHADRKEYALGYARYLGLSEALFWRPLSFLGAARMAAASDADVHCADAPLPVLIFSHGLGCTRTTYSTLCAEAASHGFVVFALEHSDGSAVLSVRPDGRTVRYVKESEAVEDTKNMEEMQAFRRRQLASRVSEVTKLVEVIRALNDGVLKVSSQSGREVNWKGALNLEKMNVAGHSFGAATALQAAFGTDLRFDACLALDAWMFPLPDETFDRAKKSAHLGGSCAPRVFFINNERFQWNTNLEKIARFAQRDEVTLRDATHQTQSDVLAMLPAFLQRRFGLDGGLGDPLAALRLSNRLSIAFLQNTLHTQLRLLAERDHQLAQLARADYLSASVGDGDVLAKLVH